MHLNIYIFLYVKCFTLSATVFCLIYFWLYIVGSRFDPVVVLISYDPKWTGRQSDFANDVLFVHFKLYCYFFFSLSLSLNSLSLWRHVFLKSVYASECVLVSSFFLVLPSKIMRLKTGYSNDLGSSMSWYLKIGLKLPFVLWYLKTRPFCALQGGRKTEFGKPVLNSFFNFLSGHLFCIMCLLWLPPKPHHIVLCMK